MPIVLGTWLFCLVTVEFFARRRAVPGSFAVRVWIATLVAVMLIELSLLVYGPAWQWLHMLRFDTDGSGFIEPNEMTPEQVRAEDASYQDTWRFGLTFATPIIYTILAISVTLLNRISKVFIKDRR